jgi:protein-L-isoaspartate(D-aspartate) O-methyltransferase
MDFINLLIQEEWLKTPRIIEAFQKIKRADFMPEDMKHLAELNEALPIGYSQTISQPLVVAFMLELLQPKPGDKILDIGSGSGWTTALLSEIVGGKGLPAVGQGEVIAVEIIPELVKFGKDNVAKYNFIEKGIAKFIFSDGSKGYKKEAPFDKILVSAESKELPSEWRGQLKIGGRMVAPIQGSIWLFIKKSNKNFEEKEHPGFAFVPLIIK